MRFRNVFMIFILLSLFGVAVGQDSPDTSVAPIPPCEKSDSYRQFDFWLGSWIVHLADGTEAGKNVISKEPGGCAIVERWMSSRGSSGISLNYFDPETDEWVQHWVDEHASLITLRGRLDHSSMILEGTIYYPDKNRTNRLRGTWTPFDDGRVRQYFEESSDGGVTWKDWFEGFYTRVPPAEK